MLKTEAVINRILTQGEASKLASDYLQRFPIDNELPSKAEIRAWLEGHDQINLFTDRQLPILHNAVELAAAFSHERLQLREARQASSPSAIVKMIEPDMRGLKQEVLIGIALDVKNNVIAKREIYRGTLDASVVHPREIYHFAIEHQAASVIICHNHPSGDPTPSIEDRQVTKQLAKAGELMQIKLLDHIIIGDGNYVSLRQDGEI